MHLRVLGLLAVMAMLLFVAQPLVAAEVMEGTVVKADNNKITMADKDGKNEHTHPVARTAEITLDGKECKLADLKKGFTIKITHKGDQRRTATKIEAKSS